jgi:hypothetical protein
MVPRLAWLFPTSSLLLEDSLEDQIALHISLSHTLRVHRRRCLLSRGLPFIQVLPRIQWCVGTYSAPTAESLAYCNQWPLEFFDVIKFMEALAYPNERLLDWPLRNWNTVKFKFRFATWSWHSTCRASSWIKFRILFRRIYDVRCSLAVKLRAYQLPTILAAAPSRSLPTAFASFISVISIEILFEMREGKPESHPFASSTRNSTGLLRILREF